MRRCSPLIPAVLMVVALAAAPTPAIAQTAPANDDFANATLLTPGGGTLLGETTADATPEAGEPSHDGLPFTPVHSVWYRWTPEVDALAVIEITVPSADEWDPVLAIYTGSAVDALTPMWSTSTFDRTIWLGFPATAGTTYQLAVDGRDGTESGPFDLTWSIPAPNDNFAFSTVMSGDAGSLIGQGNEYASAEPGEPNHNGVAPSRSVWYEWTPTISGNAVMSVTSLPYSTWRMVMAVYTGTEVAALTPVIGGGGATAVAVDLEFRVDAGTTYRVAVDGTSSTQTGSFDLTWSFPAPPNDDLANATALGGEAGWLLGETNEWASAEPGEPSHGGLAGTPARSVWYRWTAPAAGRAVVKGSTAPYSAVTSIVLAAYTGAAVDGLTEVAAADGSGMSGVRLEFDSVAGTTYHIVLDGSDEDETSDFDLTWALSPPPNDDFADPIELDERSGTLSGTTEGATPEIGEPAHAGVPGTPARSVWYEWTTIWDGDATIDLSIPSAPDDWDGVVAVYTGHSFAALKIGRAHV